MPTVIDRKNQVVKINQFVDQSRRSIKTILSFPFKNFSSSSGLQQAPQSG